MENNQSPSKNNLISTKKEKFLRKVDYEPILNSAHSTKKSLLLDLEIFPKAPTCLQTSQRVLVSIKPRAPVIKTLYIAEKRRFHSQKGTSGVKSRLGIGDYSSYTTANYTERGHNFANPLNEIESTDSEIKTETSDPTQPSTSSSKCTQIIFLPQIVSSNRRRPTEKCDVHTHSRVTMHMQTTPPHADRSKLNSNKVYISSYINDNSFEDSGLPINNTIDKLSKRIRSLENKILRQEMVFRSMNANLRLSSSKEEPNDNAMNTLPETAIPGCSYIEQYSRIPGISAFQRYTHQTAPLSHSKATTLEKEHNSEQYGRDFTTYDGITARGRRQCASVPCKRADVPKMAAERVHKIRHKLNPVRDYRLMDTVHYLAQGEFAPRDDGIKLTPSREAVLSDIIYEDVCRTHWPNTRLSRRAQPERCSTRYELQRLIDSLLRERVAHVERRRRRHYRIVKLNHRHENCRAVGKTGDIIVASHKNREANKDITIRDHNAASAMMSERHYEERNPRRIPRSHDRFLYPEMQTRRTRGDNDPGPSHASRSPKNKEATCCYHTSNHIKTDDNITNQQQSSNRKNFTSSSSISTCQPQVRKPRLVVRKESSRRKYITREGPDLDHFILLPTLVVRTPSNVKRQKKFNELYHRILNGQLNNQENECNESFIQSEEHHSYTNVKKDIGFNINITLSDDMQGPNTKL